MPAQCRRRIDKVVKITVIKRYRHQRPSASGHATHGQHFFNSHDLAMPGEKLHLSLELFDADRQIVTGGITNSMVEQHGNPRRKEPPQNHTMQPEDESLRQAFEQLRPHWLRIRSILSQSRGQLSLLSKRGLAIGLARPGKLGLTVHRSRQDALNRFADKTCAQLIESKPNPLRSRESLARDFGRQQHSAVIQPTVNPMNAAPDARPIRPELPKCGGHAAKLREFSFVEVDRSQAWRLKYLRLQNGRGQRKTKIRRKVPDRGHDFGAVDIRRVKHPDSRVSRQGAGLIFGAR